MRTSQTSLHPLLGTAAFCVTLLVADEALAQSDAVGFGSLKRTFNVTQSISEVPGGAGDDGIWGVEFVDGLLYVTGSPPLNAAADGGGFGFGPRVYIVHPVSTAVLGSFTIPEFDFTYDLASDLAGNLIVGGGEGAIVYDRSGNRLDWLVSDVGTVLLSESPRGIPMIQGPSLGRGIALGRYAGLAFNPSGDGGNGSIFVGDTSNLDSMYQVKVTDGATIEEYENRGWTVAGLAFDPLTGNLWCNSRFPETIMELDTSDLLEPTGHTMEPLALQPNNVFKRPGGVGIVPGGTPGYAWASEFDLVSLSQQGADYIGFHRLHQIPGVPGHAESYLAGSTGTEPIARTTPIMFEYRDTLNWGMVHNGRGNYGGPAIHILNLRADASMSGITSTAFLGVQGTFQELVALSLISVPSSSTALYQTDALVGDPTVSPPLPSGVSSVTLPGKFPVHAGDLIRIQSIYFDPNAPTSLPLVASNVIFFKGR